MKEDDHEKDDILDLHDGVKRFAEELREWKRDLEERRKAEWERLVGTCVLEEMLKSSYVARTFVSHADPCIRRVALSVLFARWGQTAEYAELCESIAWHDADPEVRCTALYRLGDCNRKTNDTRIGKLLAETALDNSQPVRIRKAAYHALLTLRGVPASKWKEVLRARFSDEVDWSVVSDCLGRVGE